MKMIHDVSLEFSVKVIVSSSEEGTISCSVMIVIYALEDIRVVFIEAVYLLFKGCSQQLSHFAFRLHALLIEFFRFHVLLVELLSRNIGQFFVKLNLIIVVQKSIN